MNLKSLDKKAYVAIPYQWNPGLSFIVANKVASRLMEEGYVVFSPISHSHPISNYLDEKYRFNHEFWLSQDLAFLKECDEMFLVYIGDEGEKLVENSRGCQAEIECAVANKIPINVYKYKL